ncbi:protein CASP [Achaetomium macrosporum]|uniref:Protein CASP n=1 Tax=Achaetomium macrosporum TaxID=79813 RepID=A0AAN7CHE6_9PEZI|nr:protein CASP [Achaetomium macrosporum]
MAERNSTDAPGAGAAAPTSPTTASSVNKFQSAISQWRSLDFTTLVSNLDNTASEIVTFQRDSTVQRKDLAQKTKDFRKLDDASKLTEIKGLLKAYQTFIDLLTNHSKSVNSAFLHAYTSLSEAPDPYPLLEASVDSMLVSEDTLPKLSQENQHLQKTVSRLTTQLEDIESRLQTERDARKKLEGSLESKVKEVEESWTAVLEEKKDNWAAKEKALEDKIENQDRLLNEIKASYEVNQRLGKSDDTEEGQRGHVTSAELEMVNSDLERTSARLAEMEARNEQLRLELAQAKSQVPAQPSTALEDDPGYMRVRSENSSLIRKLDAARVEKEGLKRDWDAKLRGLEREVGLLRDERDNLKAKVQKWSDYDEIKQELEVLKSIEFSTGEDEEMRDVAVGDDSAATKAKGDTLEQLLLARNKKLSDELTILRVSHQDLQSRLQTLQGELSRTNAELEKSQSLNEKLENELSTIQAEAPNAFPSGASVAGTYGMGGGSGILPMITAQRDRFKKRNAQLEQELSETHRTVSQLRQEIAALQRDNLNLYEKTRYVSTYNRSGPVATTSSSSAYAANPNPSAISISSPSSPGGGPAGGIALDRYRKAYESNLSPFAAFRGRESARAYKRMSVPERMVYSVARMVLASRTSRNLFALYCVALHLLVFFSLYWLGTADMDRSMVGAAAMAAGAGAAKSMHASLLFLSALGASVWAAPTYPRIDADASVPDNIRTVSEYFNLLATKVRESRLLDAVPVCDLSHLPLPAAASGLPSPSPGLTLKHIAIGRGTQNYTCNTNNPSEAPRAVGAVATLYNASCIVATNADLATTLALASMHFQVSQSEATQKLAPSNLAVSGRHFFTGDGTPFFNLDVSAAWKLGEIPCAKNGSMPAPADAPKGLTGETAVPWLKLNAKQGATGGLQEVYRVQTVGGSAPATCEGMPASFEVQYATE